MILFLTLTLSVNFAGAQWRHPSGPYGASVKCLAVSGTTVFSGTGGGGIYASVDKGRHWKEVNGLPVFSLVVNGTTFFASMYDQGVLLSTDNGVSWQAANTGLPTSQNSSTPLPIYNLAVCGTTIFAETSTDIFLSTNNGGSWTLLKEIRGRLTVKGTSIFAVTPDKGVLLSTDNGSNWTEINNGLPINWAPMVVVASGSNLFAGTPEGVFLSTNNGTSWKAINEGLSGMGMDIQSLFVSGTSIFAGTRNNGIWKRSLTEVTAINSYEQNSGIQIYPNPASEKITIDPMDNSHKEILLSIFDMAGQQIMSGKFENQNKREIDVSGYAKGIYVLKIQTGNTTENKKLIIQ